MDLIHDMGQGNLICKKYKIKKGVEKSTPFVLKAGLEPARTNVHWILSPACLPIPPLEHIFLSWSEKRGSNPRPQPWQGCALPTELFSQF